MATRSRTAVVAVGGNSLIIDKDHQSIPDQAAAAALTAHHIAELAVAGWNVVITHGSGPQVGFILRHSEIAIDEVPPVPMDYAAADLQGAIGYMFQRALRNEFRRRQMARKAITVVTQVLVDRGDPAFADPTKPIGSYMDEDTGRRARPSSAGSSGRMQGAAGAGSCPRRSRRRSSRSTRSPTSRKPVTW